MDQAFLDKNKDLAAKIRAMNLEQLRELRKKKNKGKSKATRTRKSVMATSARKTSRVEKH